MRLSAVHRANCLAAFEVVLVAMPETEMLRALFPTELGRTQRSAARPPRSYRSMAANYQ